MKIDHRCSQTCMSETFLYIQQALSILKQMACGTMAKSMNRDGMVERGLYQGILHNDTDISRLDGLRCHSFAMCFENEIVTGIPFLEAAEHGELLF